MLMSSITNKIDQQVSPNKWLMSVQYHENSYKHTKIIILLQHSDPLS